MAQRAGLVVLRGASGRAESAFDWQVKVENELVVDSTGIVNALQFMITAPPVTMPLDPIPKKLPNLRVWHTVVSEYREVSRRHVL